MAILNTKPIVTNPFGIWWLTDISLIKPNDTNTRLSVQFVPFNGTYILNISPKILHLDVEKTKDDTLNTVLNSLYDELERQYRFKNSKYKTFQIRYFNVRAQDLNRPIRVIAQLIIDDKIESFIINNVFTLATTDAVFGRVVSIFIDELGRQAKLKKIIE